MSLRLAPLLLAATACAAPHAPTPAASSAAAASAPAPPLPDAPVVATVARVVDGDTLVLLDGTHVRVLGIDALERDDPDPRVHALAEQAKIALTQAVAGRAVRVIVGPEPRDRYGRTLAYVERDGEDVGAALLQAGLARTYPAAHPRAGSYLAIAREAQHAGRGLWTEPVLRALHAWPEAATCAEAASKLDALVRVRGTVQGDRRGPKVQVLTLRDGTGALALVIFPSRYDEIPRDVVDTWNHREVEVTGTVGVFRGRPQIVLEDPWQLELAGASH